MPAAERARRGLPLLAGLLLLLGGAGAACAAGENGVTAAMPEHSVAAGAEETHPPLRLRPGRPEIVRLEEPVGDVAVKGTRKQLTAIAYGSKTVALFPGRAGASHITIRGKDGRPIMSRYVFIAELGSKYLRIRHACGKKAPSRACGGVRVYYCTNVCYETHVMELPQAALR